MVERIAGYDKSGRKVFERPAREYDHGIANTKFGVSIGDLVKAIPIIFLAGILYAGQQKFNEGMTVMVSNNTKAINSIEETLGNLNNYLSSSTGKQFKDGRPLSMSNLRELKG